MDGDGLIFLVLKQVQRQWGRGLTADFIEWAAVIGVVGLVCQQILFVF